MGRLNFYTTETNYNTSKNLFDYPTVAYVEETEEVKWMSIRDKYTKEYLTTEALESGAISFNILGSMGTDMIISISYSIDNGQTWTTTNNTDNKSEHLVINVNVNQGDKVLWKGNATQTGHYNTEGSFFSSDCDFNAYGNIMSLLYGDNFHGMTSLGDTTSTFACLFSDYYGEKTCEVVSAQNLILPATTLTTGCYSNMFYKCTSLTTAPELPATTLAQYCYSYMFNGCTQLNYIKAMFTTAPSSLYTDSWVNGVASTGTFVKNSAATWTTTGANGVPTGWTVQTA